MSLLNTLMQELGSDATKKIGNQMGLDEQSANSAIAGALPLLLGGLARNTQKEGGADALLGALERDHDGTVLDNVDGYVSKGPGSDGDGILGHVFGNKRPTVEAGLGKMSGIDTAKAGQLMAMIAPLVMGALAKQQQTQQLDAKGLSNMLSSERENASAGAGKTMGMVGKLLDRDGDGDFTDDVAKMGAGLLGNLFGGKR